jgi:hypothetical protein
MASIDWAEKHFYNKSCKEINNSQRLLLQASTTPRLSVGLLAFSGLLQPLTRSRNDNSTKKLKINFQILPVRNKNPLEYRYNNVSRVFCFKITSIFSISPNFPAKVIRWKFEFYNGFFSYTTEIWVIRRIFQLYNVFFSYIIFFQFGLDFLFLIILFLI